MFIDTLKPNLTPERQELSRTVAVIHTLAHNTIQHDAGVLHRKHASGFLVYTVVDAADDARSPAAMPCHLLLKTHAAIEPVGVEGLDNLLLGPYADELAWL